MESDILNLVEKLKKENSQLRTELEEIKINQKKHEKKLKIEQELFEGIFSNIPVMITIYDPELKNFRFNREVTKILGWTENDARDDSFMSRVYPDPDYRNEVIRFMQSLETGWKEWRMKGKYGSEVDSIWANIFLASGIQVGIGIDIRERKLAEETIRKNEERLKSLFDNLAIGVVVVDANDRFLEVNPRFCSIMGYSRDEILQKKVSDITAPQDLLLSQDLNARLHRGELLNFNYEKRYLKKDGSPLWVHVTVSAIRDLQGHLIYSIGTVEDISGRKNVEEELHRSEERFRLAIEAADLGTWDFDIETGVANHSLRHDQVFGYAEPQPEWSYEISVQHILPEFHPTVRKAVADAIETGILTYDAKVKWPDGSIHWIAPRGRVFYDGNGNPLRMAGIVSDITERKMAEEAVKESEEMFSTMYEVVPIGISIASLDNGTLQNVNKAWLEISGFAEKDEVLGKTTAELGMMQENGRDHILNEFRKHGRVRNAETSFVNKSGVRRIVSVNVDKIFLRGQMYLISTNEDITEQKKAEQEIRQKNEELTRFIYTVSHDLKSPLVTIKSFTSFLKEDIENLDREALEKDIRYIENAADKMGKLLDELLELSRIGRKEETVSEIPLDSVVQSSIDLVAGRISGKNVKVIFTAPPVILHGHSQRLIQLYQNLIDNAVKFMGKQAEPLIEIGAFIDRERNDETVLFVKDNGQGIDPRYHHKLFGLFEKLDNSTEGTGIGLALVKRIVETHGGYIWFTSDIGVGTTFFFTLSGTKILKEK